MLQPLQAVLFDYGLVLTGPPDPAAWANMQQITGLPEDTFSAAYWAPRHAYDRGDHNGRAYWNAVGQHATLVLTPNQIDALIAADNALWTQINEPMQDWARRLQAAGTPTGILSNLGDEMMHGVLAAFPWMESFNHRVWSHTLNLAKPEREIYLEAAKGLNLLPGQILFIDDKEENIAAAEAVGMQAIRYTEHTSFVQSLTQSGLADLWETGRLPTDSH